MITKQNPKPKSVIMTIVMPHDLHQALISKAAADRRNKSDMARLILADRLTTGKTAVPA